MIAFHEMLCWKLEESAPYFMIEKNGELSQHDLPHIVPLPYRGGRYKGRRIGTPGYLVRSKSKMSTR
jgi:hypothetical protein